MVGLGLRYKTNMGFRKPFIRAIILGFRMLKTSQPYLIKTFFSLLVDFGKALQMR